MPPLDETTFEWEQSPDALVIRLPAPPPEERSPGCAAAVLLAAVLVTLPIPIMVIAQLVNGSPIRGGIWVVYGIVAIVTLILLRYARVWFREARLPPRAVEASRISVSDGVLSVERAEPKREMDYSWELSEIADLRICAAAPDRVYLSPKSLLLKQALAPQELIRVSVERYSGEVDDVFVLAPGRYWTDALETRLRAYLGLSSPVDPATKSGNEEGGRGNGAA